ncbi:MAG: hypothetical protein KF773_13115 [Deltaproteobacteria bacterium]|nr:hypothetical protein [Deltaproteobacteria bacterium]MCW5805384.1 hypothetical protein [Deltaproteobacteria bacterium]
MSDTKSPEPKKLPVAKAAEEPSVGEGGRSLANWEKLASARRDLSSNDKARASMKDDPKAFLATYGINANAFSESGGQMGLTSLERQLAFSGGVERDSLGVHRGCELVVGPVAGAVAGAVVAAAAAAVTAAAAANVAWVANWVAGVGEK